MHISWYEIFNIIAFHLNLLLKFYVLFGPVHQLPASKIGKKKCLTVLSSVLFSAGVSESCFISGVIKYHREQAGTLLSFTNYWIT